MKKIKKANYVLFRAALARAGMTFPEYGAFVKYQYALLCSGYRGVDIHDASLVAWATAGGE